MAVRLVMKVGETKQLYSFRPANAGVDRLVFVNKTLVKPYVDISSDGRIIGMQPGVISKLVMRVDIHNQYRNPHAGIVVYSHDIGESMTLNTKSGAKVTLLIQRATAKFSPNPNDPEKVDITLEMDGTASNQGIVDTMTSVLYDAYWFTENNTVNSVRYGVNTSVKNGENRPFHYQWTFSIDGAENEDLFLRFAAIVYTYSRGGDTLQGSVDIDSPSILRIPMTD